MCIYILPKTLKRPRIAVLYLLLSFFFLSLLLIAGWKGGLGEGV